MISEFSCLVGVPAEDILGRSRERRIIDARHLYWKLLRDKSGLSYPRIGMLNERTACTIMHGVSKSENLIAIGDKEMCRMWERVKDLRYK